MLQVSKDQSLGTVVSMKSSSFREETGPVVTYGSDEDQDGVESSHTSSGNQEGEQGEERAADRADQSSSSHPEESDSSRANDNNSITELSLTDEEKLWKRYIGFGPLEHEIGNPDREGSNEDMEAASGAGIAPLEPQPSTSRASRRKSKTSDRAG